MSGAPFVLNRWLLVLSFVAIICLHITTSDADTREAISAAGDGQLPPESESEAAIPSAQMLKDQAAATTTSHGGVTTHDQDIGGENNHAYSKPHVDSRDMYLRLFKHKRASHKEAIKTIMALKTYDKQYKMLELLNEKLYTVMTEGKVKLMELGFTPGDPFPTNQTVLEAFSNVAENTAFFGDMLLHLPSVVHELLRRHKDWDLMVRWGVSFCQETTVFTGPHATLLHLMAQELDIIEKEEGYVNPYKIDFRKEIGDALINEVKQKKNKKKPKKKHKRGPRMSGSLHTEL